MRLGEDELDPALTLDEGFELRRETVEGAHELPGEDERGAEHLVGRLGERRGRPRHHAAPALGGLAVDAAIERQGEEDDGVAEEGRSAGAVEPRALEVDHAEQGDGQRQGERAGGRFALAAGDLVRIVGRGAPSPSPP